MNAMFFCSEAMGHGSCDRVLKWALAPGCGKKVSAAWEMSQWRLRGGARHDAMRLTFVKVLRSLMICSGLVDSPDASFERANNTWSEFSGSSVEGSSKATDETERRRQ